MFDTMTLTKTVGALCSMLLVFLLGKWAAEGIYHMGGGHGYGEEHHQAYSIPTGDEEDADEAVVVEAGPTFEEVFQTASADSGERLFRACQACHRLEAGANATGPYLYGVVGRDIGAADGFNYSGALSEAAEVWTPENLNAFLENPRGWAPGTSMAYNGMDDVEDRANLIAYLQSIGG
jgi:cytochrome c